MQHVLYNNGYWHRSHLAASNAVQLPMATLSMLHRLRTERTGICRCTVGECTAILALPRALGQYASAPPAISLLGLLPNGPRYDYQYDCASLRSSVGRESPTASVRALVD